VLTLAIESDSVAVDLLAVMACAGLVPLLLHRLRIALIPGYLIAGVIIGPLLGVVNEAERIEEMASLAIVLLMFTIGLHLDFRSFRSALGPIVAVGVISTALNTLLIGLAAMAFGLAWQSALVIGMALAMSSTAAVLKLLQQRRELNRPHGRLAFGVLIMQDLAVVAVLAVIPLLAAAGDSGKGAISIDRAVLQLAVVGLLILFGRVVLTRVLAYAVRVGGAELVLVIGAGAALGAAVATAAVGLSGELGAFVAGMILATSPVRHQLSGQLAPLRDLFMALFFTVVGLAVDPATIGGAWWVLLITVPLLMVVKFLVLSFFSWAGGASPAVSVRTGMVLAQSGEFSLVVLMAAGRLEILDSRVEALVIATVFVSLLLTPALIAASGHIGFVGGLSRVAPWVRDAVFVERPGAAEGRAPSQVIIAGFGPVGRACAERLDKAGIRFTIIELNSRTVHTQGRLGRSILYGDATNPSVLESAGIEDARALILTILDEQAMLQACRVARHANPDVFIAARAAVLSHALHAKEIGANAVMVDEIAAALAMSDEVVKRLSGLEAVERASIDEATDLEAG